MSSVKLGKEEIPNKALKGGSWKTSCMVTKNQAKAVSRFGDGNKKDHIEELLSRLQEAGKVEYILYNILLI